MRRMRSILPLLFMVALAWPHPARGDGWEVRAVSLPWTYISRELLWPGDVTFSSGYRPETADRLASRVARSATRGYRVRVDIVYSPDHTTREDLFHCRQVLNVCLDRRLGRFRDRVLVTWKPGEVSEVWP